MALRVSTAGRGPPLCGWGWRVVVEATGILQEARRRRYAEAGKHAQHPSSCRGRLNAAHEGGAESAWNHMVLALDGTGWVPSILFPPVAVHQPVR